MNIFYIYVLFIAIYFSLCQMSYEEIELNFGEDNSNKMFIRTINETHVIVGTEKNIAILDLVNKELKNDSIFSSIIINGMIEPFLVNTTDMKILIYEDIEHNSHGYNLNTKEKFSHGNYFNKIHSIGNCDYSAAGASSAASAGASAAATNVETSASSLP